jgi:uncharacterized low-complexity protein
MTDTPRRYVVTLMSSNAYSSNARDVEVMAYTARDAVTQAKLSRCDGERVIGVRPPRARTLQHDNGGGTLICGACGRDWVKNHSAEGFCGEGSTQ